MRPVRVIILAVAVVAALLTALLARRWMHGQEARMEPAAAAIALAEVVVAARDLPAGSLLLADDLRFEPWPASVAGKLLVRGTGDDPRAALAGQTVRRDLFAGEPVTAQALRPNRSGMLAGMLGAGNRAVSVAISNTSAAAGFVTPGDRVDVVLAADLLRTEGNNAAHNGPMVRYAAETVLTDVRVLAIDQSTRRNNDGGAVEGKTATLEVTPKQAELLAAAAMLGSLSLALRSADAAEPVRAAIPFTADTEASRALDSLHNSRPKVAAGAAKSGGAQVIVNRAGQISAQSFGQSFGR